MSITTERLENFSKLLVEIITDDIKNETNSLFTTQQWMELDEKLTPCHEWLQLRDNENGVLEQESNFPDENLQASVELLVRVLYEEVRPSITSTDLQLQEFKQELGTLYVAFTTEEKPIAGPVTQQDDHNPGDNSTVKAIDMIRRQKRRIQNPNTQIEKKNA